MILSKFIEGLQILQKYFSKDGYHIGAEHDVFYVYPPDLPISKEDTAKLRSLGWAQCYEDENAEVHNTYDASEGWEVFV